MNLWREDQNEDIQFVMEKGEQVLNVSVKYKWYSWKITKHILNAAHQYPIPPFFSQRLKSDITFGFLFSSLNFFFLLITNLLLNIKKTIDFKHAVYLRDFCVMFLRWAFPSSMLSTF